MASKLHDSFADHPGGWLRAAEIVEPTGLIVTALPERPHVAGQALSSLL